MSLKLLIRVQVSHYVRISYDGGNFIMDTFAFFFIFRKQKNVLYCKHLIRWFLITFLWKMTFPNLASVKQICWSKYPTSYTFTLLLNTWHSNFLLIDFLPYTDGSWISNNVVTCMFVSTYKIKLSYRYISF